MKIEIGKKYKNKLVSDILQCLACTSYGSYVFENLTIGRTHTRTQQYCEDNLREYDERKDWKLDTLLVVLEDEW